MSQRRDDGADDGRGRGTVVVFDQHGSNERENEEHKMTAYSITRDDSANYVAAFVNGDGNDQAETFSDFDSLVSWIASRDDDYVLLRDDHVSNHADMLNALYDFASMSRDESRIIHARAHSRRNAFRECAYCVRDFIDKEERESEGAVFVRPVNSRMSHDSCGHDSTKAARAKCRRERRKAEGTMLADDGMEIVISE